MKYVSAAFLVLALGLAADARAICTTSCTAVVMPGVPKVELPLVGWVYSGAGTVTVAEMPEYGTWDNVNETYEPSEDFREVGIDRMTVHQSGAYRTLIFVAAQPIEETVSDSLETPAVFEGGTWGALGDISLQLPEKGDQSGIAQVGGTLGAKVNPPDAPLSGTRRILDILDFVHVEVDSSSEGPPQLVAIADSSLGCTGPGCRTAGIVIPTDEQHYTFTLILGRDVLGVASADDSFTLWFKACGRAIDGDCQVRSLAGLDEVALYGEISFEAGLLAGDTRDSGIEIEWMNLWRLEPSGEDEDPSFFDDFSSSPFTNNYWDPLGAEVNTALQGESNLQGMVYASVDTFRDNVPSNARRLRTTFDLDTTALALDHNESVIAFFGQSDSAVGGTTKSFDLFVKSLNGSTFIRGRLIRDDGTVALTDPITIAAGVHTVGLHFFGADAAVSGSTGFLKLKVGSTYEEVHLTTLANNLLREVDRYSVGASQPTLDTNTGNRYLRFDNVTVHFAH